MRRGCFMWSRTTSAGALDERQLVQVERERQGRNILE
jgi:hypothetical protein